MKQWVGVTIVTPGSSRGFIVTTQMLSNRLKALASARLPEHRTLASRSEAVKDIYDYYPEVERLLKAGDWRRCVLIFDHFVRNPLLAERGEKGAREPAKIVHND
jgi:hypothetical protein